MDVNYVWGESHAYVDNKKAVVQNRVQADIVNYDCRRYQDNYVAVG